MLDRLLRRATPALALLCGPGGVGKSALARWWSHAARDGFTDGQLYADLGGFSDAGPVDPGETLASFLRALGVAPERIPLSLAEQTSLYRTITAGRALLVVLDDAYSAGQVRPLLPASPSAVLVTSRRRLVGLLPDGAEMLEIGPLSPEESMQLLALTVGRERVDREQEPAAELAAICGGLPIALNVAASRLAARPRLSLRAMVAVLADETNRLTHLATVDGPSVRATLDVSYRGLRPETAALYRALAWHPGPEFSQHLIAAAATRSADLAASSHDPLDELLTASLLDEVAENRFRFHDLLRLHAREMSLLHDSEQARRNVLHRMLEFYLAAATQADLAITPYRRRLPYAFHHPPQAFPELADRVRALDWLTQERLNLLHAGKAALNNGHPELAWQLSDVMWPLLLYRKNYRDRLEIDERGVAAARSWGNDWAEANMLKRLSRACERVGDTDAAVRHALQAIGRYEKAGDARGRLDAEEGLATLYLGLDEQEKAELLLTRILPENRDLGDSRSIGLTCINLATLWTRSARAVDALPLLLEAKRIFAELDDIDPYNAARVLIALAEAHLSAGDTDVAEREATEAVHRMTELGSDHERAEALTLLGGVAHIRGHAHLARRYYEQAVDILDILGSPRLRDVTRRLQNLDPDAEPVVDSRPSVARDVLDPPAVQDACEANQ
ncbi:NB-ARC domain-containing protein [Micromonospora sp. NPDC050397]|uniref:NB-ARC domain-containing protein n=1 Tax=Micromonospora sp. NPDC050397 TaxID=3364279 RepID=UPI00384B36BD